MTPTFTTFIAISMLRYANPADAQSRFDERVGETLLGVGVAYFFGLVVSAVGRGSRLRVPPPDGYTSSKSSWATPPPGATAPLDTSGR